MPTPPEPRKNVATTVISVAAYAKLIRGFNKALKTLHELAKWDVYLPTEPRAAAAARKTLKDLGLAPKKEA